MRFQIPIRQFDVRTIENKQHVFDVVRKKWILLTPEEYVRQQWIHFLHVEKKIPLKFLAIEKQFELLGNIRRADIVVYNVTGKPVLVIECKAPEIKLSQVVVDQAGRYNIHFKVPLLVVTNGADTRILKLNLFANSFIELNDIPEFSTLNSL